MSTPADPFTLLDWRRRVAELYAAIRRSPDPIQAWQLFRATRDQLFHTHPQTALTAEQQVAFSGLDYFPYDPAWRVVGTIDASGARETAEMLLPAEGQFRYTRVGQVQFRLQGRPLSLALFWIEGYGGGLFVPFRDPSNGRQSYGGGRYLYDTIKGADLGHHEDQLVLDFNFAYNPSCAYDDRWVCPLAPRENHLPLAVLAGEKRFAAGGAQM